MLVHSCNQLDLGSQQFEWAFHPLFQEAVAVASPGCGKRRAFWERMRTSNLQLNWIRQLKH